MTTTVTSHSSTTVIPSWTWTSEDTEASITPSTTSRDVQKLTSTCQQLEKRLDLLLKLRQARQQQLTRQGKSKHVTYDSFH
jgi:glycine cleavage system regulatory protein